MMFGSGSGSPPQADTRDADEFDLLSRTRARLIEITQLHASSIRGFRHPDRPWFRVTSDEPISESPAAVRHLTTTASCIESLADNPAVPQLETGDLAAEFGRVALAQKWERWASEGAAKIYCRVRALPAILRLAPQDVLEQHLSSIIEHLEFVWERLDPQDHLRQGISEAPDREPKADDPVDDEQPWRGYPANSFHTFWALRLVEAYEGRELPELPGAIVAKRPIAALWSARTLGTHAALVGGNVERGDANQLAWALAAQLIKPPESPLTALSETYELYRAAFAAFFAEQLPNGNWPLGEPIFHYPEAGNAYCYTFETLAELLRPALLDEGGRVVRDLLRPYFPQLLKAFGYARATAINLNHESIAWCSGHHPHRTAPEGWATASVFSFLQNLRCLVGQWTSDTASADLHVRRPRYAKHGEALDKLRERGDTWTKHGEVTVGRQLAAMFLHPILVHTTIGRTIDPDRQLISEAQARAAILFGPPGTSKTTLVEALAGALGWRYVAIHASDFLQSGMDQIPRRAAEIFRRLMELDHTVILFDEIDELIRQRGENSDPVGRFLTTSMLPKVANLWEQRRVLFFVATNDISNADPAIRRSQRFDASIYVPPPSFVVKSDLLRKRLGKALPSGFNWSAVDTALDADFDEPHALGVFALLRHDQVSELAGRIKKEVKGSDVGLNDLKRVLIRMGLELKDLEWHSDNSELNNPYRLHKHYVESQRQDFRVEQVIKLGAGTPEPAAEVLRTDPDGVRLARIAGFLLEHRTGVDDDGCWIIEEENVMARDTGLLDYALVTSDADGTV
jgi:hypothetical protein